MDIDQIKTFLSVAAHGSFLEASARLYVTQSTVSSRIQRLESELGAALFVRNRTGASLTQQGQRFVKHAKSIIVSLDQARDEMGLPSRFRANLVIGARLGLWESVLPDWVGEIRRRMPDVSIRSEIGFEDDLLRRLIQGSLDLGLMFTPRHDPALHVEHLFDETLALLSSKPDAPWPDPDYVYVEWGPGFYAQHSNSFPELEPAAQKADIGWLAAQLVLRNGGSCFLPLRVAKPFLAIGQLRPVPDTPRFTLSAYVVSARDHRSPVLAPVLDWFREFATRERGG